MFFLGKRLSGARGALGEAGEISLMIVGVVVVVVVMMTKASVPSRADNTGRGLIVDIAAAQVTADQSVNGRRWTLTKPSWVDDVSATWGSGGCGGAFR